MTFDATFWVMISFFGFVGLLIFFQVPQKIKSVLEENITNIKNQIDEADKFFIIQSNNWKTNLATPSFSY